MVMAPWPRRLKASKGFLENNMADWIRITKDNYKDLKVGMAFAAKLKYSEPGVYNIYIGYIEDLLPPNNGLGIWLKGRVITDSVGPYMDYSISESLIDLLDEMKLYSTFRKFTEQDTKLTEFVTLSYASDPHISMPPSKPKSSSIDYRFGEDGYIDELKTYIDATYGAHYSGKVGPMDIMIAGGQALGFIVGSIIKYAFRLGKKDNYKRDDVLKIAHYAILLLHTYDVLKLGDKKDG
jgi:hypothetical protein